jgi:rod shape-determining protein MreC
MPDGHNVRLWRYLVTSVITPPERLAHSIGKSVRDVWTNYIYLRHLREQNLNLQQENDRLRMEQASLAEDARQGERLREMLDFRGRYIDKTVAAQVVGTSGTDQAKVIYVDRGSKDGLQVQMPVITPDGIIGKVKNVFPHSAQVLLISDQTSGTGVLLETTRVRGVMKGNASGQPQMINISPDERIKPGEPVITSGGDQVYPPGMPVGLVDRVVADPDSSYVNVVIKPNANLAALEEVLVVTEFSDKMPFAQQKDVMRSEVVALEQKQRAADVLSEKLPSVRDPNSPETTPGANEDASSTTGEGDPARPVRPPQPLHPDRYTPGAAPPADDLVPGAAPPVTHRVPSAVASEPAATPGSKPTTAGNVSPYSGSGPVPVSRFPAKPGTSAKPESTNSVAAETPTRVTATPTSVPTTTSVPKVTAGGVSGQTSGASPSTQPGPTQAGQTQAGQTQAGQTRPGQSQSVPPARRTPIPLDGEANGILTPAGMGSIGTAAQTTPTSKPTAPKPQSPKPETVPGSQASPAPATSAPSGRSAPPPQKSTTTPPGGV